MFLQHISIDFTCELTDNDSTMVAHKHFLQFCGVIKFLSLDIWHI